MSDFPWPVHPAAELFPLLGDEELRELADDIKTHGLHEPIWLYMDRERGPVLLDGRNRVRACMLAQVPWTKRFYEGDDPIAFSISANKKRRHLTAGQLDFLALEVEKLYATEAEKRMKAGGNNALLHESESNDPRADLREGASSGKRPVSADLRDESPREMRSDERAAKVVGASGRGVSQAKRVQAKAPDLADKVKAGQMAIDRAERIIRDRESEQRRIKHAKHEAAAREAPALVDIRHGDFRDVLADLQDVDAVITDPPYPAEYLPLLADLGAWADKVLKPDGVLVVLIGQTHLPEVYRLLDGHRPYRWTGCYLTPGAGYVSHARRVQSNWKPLLVYGGGPRFADLITSGGGIADARNRHDWGQDYSAFHTIINRFTVGGQTVADPFMGSGTTLLAAHALGRHAIGCDVDAGCVEQAREWVA